MNSTQPATATSVESMRQLARQPELDYEIDFFSARGFELAQRLAKAFATSNGVPAMFRAVNEKKGPGGAITYVENPAAIGNCLIAIETARAVGVSITSVMQNANVIEGRLTWSAQYKIAAINASRRFTPLRFDVKNKGKIKAKYREKQGWNDQKRGFDFKEIEVEVENLECIAWALPFGMVTPNFAAEQMRQHSLLDLVRAAGLPVIESAPVSMKLAVEEGWYGKSGSKWQTEMKHLMLQYRAGSFFGNIHAPDVVMGMGRTAEEMEDITTIDIDKSGNVTKVDMQTMVRPAAEPADVVTAVTQVNSTEATTDEAAETADGAASASEPVDAEVFTFAHVADLIAKATTAIELKAAQDLIAHVQPEDQIPELNGKVQQREKELATASTKPASRRGNGSKPSVE